MKAAPKHVNNDSKHSATEATQSSWQNQLAQVADHRQQAVVQRALIDSINDSPRMLAQCRQIEGYLGSDTHLTTTPARPASQSSQRQAIQKAKKSSDDNPIHAQNNNTSIAPKPNNTGLPDNLKSGIESLSGISMDNVRVHYNSPKPAQLNALAYAQGTDIHLASGQEQYLPHEAWHVVQQAQGRVKPTMQMKGNTPINDDKGLEHEADVMGAEAAQMRTEPVARNDGGKREHQLRFHHLTVLPAISTGTAMQLARLTKKKKTYFEIVRKKHLKSKYKRTNFRRRHRVIHSSTRQYIGALAEALSDDELELLSTDLVDADEIDTEAPNTPVMQTTEVGYEGFNVTDVNDWETMDSVVTKSSADNTICKNSSFKLPVVCSTAAEHIIRHKDKATIPDWDPDEGIASTGVSIYGENNQEIQLNFDLGSQEIPQSILSVRVKPAWRKPRAKSNFTPSELGLGEGILAFGKSPKGVGDHHAVVVVARNTRTHEIIVVERNAGDTTGSSLYMDEHWVMNKYDGPEGFLKAVGMTRGFKLAVRY